NVEIKPLPILGSIICAVFLNNIEDFAQATLLKSPTTTVGISFLRTSFATANNSPSRSLEFSSSVGLGGGGCTPNNLKVKPSEVLHKTSILGMSSATK